MDQNKTNVPHLKRVEKSACNLWQLRTHLTGVLVHGHWSTACFDLHQWPHDTNLTMNVVLLILLVCCKISDLSASLCISCLYYHAGMVQANC